MSDTPDQVAATESLRAAIAAHAVAYDDGEPLDGFVGDFAFVAALADPDTNDEVTPYIVGYHVGHLPNHVAVGLFKVGMDIAESTRWIQEDDA